MTEIPESLKKQLEPLEPRYIKVAPHSKRPVDVEWPENRLSADNPSLKSWLNKGGNYGVVGGDGLVILDADTIQIKNVILNHLPRTFIVKSPGSGGWHAYYLSNLKHPIRLYDEKKKNVGDVQGEGKMVVGPNSIHPCGHKYAVLNNHSLVEVTEEEIREALGQWTVSKIQTKAIHARARREFQLLGIHMLDVFSFIGMKKQGHEYYGSHPTHGSTTGRNFWINSRKECWHCFRHGTGGGPLLWLAVEEGIIRCEEALPGTLRGNVFREVLEATERRGFKVPNRLKRAVLRGELVRIGDSKVRLPARSIPVTTEGYKLKL